MANYDDANPLVRILPCKGDRGVNTGATVVTSASDMTDRSKAYLYAGTTSGNYIKGHWYYFNGSAWTDGGSYTLAVVDDELDSGSDNAVKNSVIAAELAALEAEIPSVDDTLTQSEHAADALAVGTFIKSDKIAHIINGDVSGFTFTYTNNTYTIAKTKTTNYYALARGRTVTLPTETWQVNLTATSSVCVFTINVVSPVSVAIKSSMDVTPDDYIIAAFYQNKMIAFGNEFIFTGVGEQARWNAERFYNPFIKKGVLLRGTLNYDTVNRTVTLQSGGVVYGRNGEFKLGINSTYDYSEEENPSYIRFIFFDSANTQIVGAAFSDPMKELNRDTNRNSLYLLAAIFNDTYIWTSSAIAGKFFVNGIDKYIPSKSNYVQDKTCKIFRRVGCCGDSYTEGYIVDGGGVAHYTNHDYAWPHYMGTLTGNEYLNFGHSGSNVWTWQTNARGLQVARAAGKCDAYLIGLGINDSTSSSDTSHHIDIGVPADVGSENRTYYAGLSKIVRELHEISPDAHIFIQNLPRTASAVDPYNEAMAYIAERYHDDYKTHLLDLRAHIDMYQVPAFIGDELSGHYTAIGYQIMSENLAIIWSEYINAHISEFQDVAFIPIEEEA